MSAPVKQSWFSACRSFLRQTIEETAAPTVIALGRCSYESVAKAYGVSPIPFRQAIEAGSPIRLDAQRVLFTVFHPAARAKDRTLAQMRSDWAHIAESLKAYG